MIYEIVWKNEEKDKKVLEKGVGKLQIQDKFVISYSVTAQASRDFRIYAS